MPTVAKTIGPGALNRLRKTHDFATGAEWSANFPVSGSVASGGGNNPLTGTSAGVFTLNDTDAAQNYIIRQATQHSTTNPQPIRTTFLVDKKLYTFSIYVKKGTAAKTRIDIIHSDSANTAGVLITWPVGSTPITFESRHANTDSTFNYRNYNVQQIGTDGWYRAQVTVQYKQVGTNSLRVQIYPAGDASIDTGTTIVYGPQLEEGNVATAYQEITTDVDPFVCDYRLISEFITATNTGILDQIDEGRLCGYNFPVLANTLSLNRTAGQANTATTYRRLTTGTLNGVNFKYDPVTNIGAKIIVTYATTGNEYGLRMVEDFSRLDNFGIFADIQNRPTSGTKDLILLGDPTLGGPSSAKVSNLFIDCERGGKPYADTVFFQGLRILGSSGNNAVGNNIFNTIVRGGGSSRNSVGMSVGYFWDQFSSGGGAYNCVAYGMNAPGSLGVGFSMLFGTSLPEVINCIATDCSVGFSGLASVFDNNISSDASAEVGIDGTPDVKSKANIPSTALFISADANDFRLRAGSVAIDAGSDQNTKFTTDIGTNADFAGTTRTGKTWDIGAYEGATVTPNNVATIINKSVGKGLSRDYPNIQAFIKALPKSLPSANQRWVATCYDDGIETLGETTRLELFNCVTDSGRYVEIKPAVYYNPKTGLGHRLHYVADYNQVVNDRAVLWITSDFTRVSGILLGNKSTNFLTGGTLRNVPAIEVNGDNCILDAVTGVVDGNIAPSFSPVFDIGGFYNTITNCYARGSNTVGTGATVGFRTLIGTFGNQFFHCNTYRIQGVATGVAAGSNGFQIGSNWKYVRISGCIAAETNTSGTVAAKDYSVGASLDGISDANAEEVVLDHCISLDTSAVGFASKNSTTNPGITAAIIWQNPTLGDFRLKIGSPAINAGANLTQFTSTDLLGNGREPPFDIGAIEGVAFSPLMLSPRPRDAHRFASLWEIIRKDGASHYFCSANEPLQFKGITYKPTGATSASARRMESGLREHNVEILGAISSTEITNTALAAGLYNGAKVNEYVIDWRYPFTEPYATRKYTIGSLTFSQDEWKANLVGPTHPLERNTGELITKGCPYQLGDSDCQFALQTVIEVNRQVSSVSSTEPRRQFVSAVTSAISNATDDFFGAGKVTWTTGNNAGVESEVKVYTGASKTVRLAFLTPFDIQVGDKFNIQPGCRKRFLLDCVGKYNNGINFGGRPEIPGSDRAFETPVR